MDIQIFTHLCVIEAYDEYTGAGGALWGMALMAFYRGAFESSLFHLLAPGKRIRPRPQVRS